VDGFGELGVLVKSGGVVPGQEERDSRHQSPRELDQDIGQHEYLIVSRITSVPEATHLPGVNLGRSLAYFVNGSRLDKDRKHLFQKLSEQEEELFASACDRVKKIRRLTMNTEKSWLCTPCCELSASKKENPIYKP
jgi:hypothetical protein